MSSNTTQRSDRNHKVIPLHTLLQRLSHGAGEARIAARKNIDGAAIDDIWRARREFQNRRNRYNQARYESQRDNGPEAA